MIKLFNPRMIRERIAQLSAMSESPTNCAGQPSREEARAEMLKLEGVLAECRARKKANPGEPSFIACLSEKLTGPAATPSAAAVKNAVQARLAAGKASLAAAEAKARAKAAVAAVATAQKPATATPHLDKFNALKGGEAAAYFKEHRRMIGAEQTAANIEAKTGQKCTISATGIISRTSKI